MRSNFFLLILIGFQLFAFTCNTAKQQADFVRFHENKLADTTLNSVFASLHWTIERSPVDTVAKYYQQSAAQNQFPTSAIDCADGEYFGETLVDDYGYKHIVLIKIKGGKIIKIDYDEIDKTGKGKQFDLHYCEKMSVTGTTPAIAYPIYEKQMIAKQDLMKVDAVSGATYSLYRFRYAVNRALFQAKR